MVTEVYADLLFLINFSMDYLCLYICARVLHRRIGLFRTILSATIGGLYSIFALLTNIEGIAALIIDICVCIIMCAIVFAERKRAASSTLLCSFLYLGISMMTGGAMTAVFHLLNRLDLPIDSIDEDGISPYVFIILAVISGLITLRSGELVSKRSTVKTCTLTIDHNGKSIEFCALSDSGNLVKDPLSNKPIIVVDRQILASIVDINIFDKFQSGVPPEDHGYKGMRIIPIKTASGSSLLVAFSPDKITIEAHDPRKKKSFISTVDALIAPAELGNVADGCNAIIPAELLKI